MLAARGGQVQRFGQPDFLRHGGVHHCLEARVPEQLEHGVGFLGARAEVPVDESIAGGGPILSQRHPLKLRFADGKASGISVKLPAFAGNRENTTGSVGQKSRPQLMVFQAKIFAK